MALSSSESQSKREIHLVLFLSRATPLARWQAMGILERELALYRQVAKLITQVTIVTSGGEDEYTALKPSDSLKILTNRWRLSPNVYSVLAPILHWRALRHTSIFKTNQLDGAWTAILAGWLHRKPVVVRAGYLWAEDNRGEGGGGFKAWLIDQMQRFSFRSAGHIFLTTPAMKTHIAQRYRLPAQRISVVANNVDTERFVPVASVQRIERQVCYIGRLHPRKNLDLLIEAISMVPKASLLLIGQGEDQERLEDVARRTGANVTFAGVVDNQYLPKRIQESHAFVLPSQFEGHPKALLEAMACGIPVIGTDVPGIREQIEHGHTGLLCAESASAIKEALEQVFQDESLAQVLGKNARAYILENFALHAIAGYELQQFERLLGLEKN